MTIYLFIDPPFDEIGSKSNIPEGAMGRRNRKKQRDGKTGVLFSWVPVSGGPGCI